MLIPRMLKTEDLVFLRLKQRLSKRISYLFLISVCSKRNYFPFQTINFSVRTNADIYVSQVHGDTCQISKW